MTHACRTFTTHEHNLHRFLRSAPFDRIEGISHAFTTRANGLGRRTGGIKLPGDWDAVARFFGRDAGSVLTITQVHGADIVRISDRHAPDTHAVSADAMITDRPGLLLGIETADCVPILLVDPVVRAIGAVHAGWRGTVADIARKTVAAMQDAYGAQPERMIAAIGPAIGSECYEVDEPVMQPMRAAFPFWEQVAIPTDAGRWRLDLVTTNALALEQAGLSRANIHALGLCTACERDDFYSFRIEGRTGRMLSAIMIKEHSCL